MPYYDVGNLVTVTKTNLIQETPCGYGTLRTIAVMELYKPLGLWNPINHCCENTALSLPQSGAEVSSCSRNLRRPVQRSQLLQSLTIL
jgi:hypothetical protein